MAYELNIDRVVYTYGERLLILNELYRILLKNLLKKASASYQIVFVQVPRYDKTSMFGNNE